MEIEVKAKLRDKEAVVAKLIALGCVFSDPKTQDDMVWAEKTAPLDAFLANPVFLRIRVQDGHKVILTAKKPKGAAGNASLVKREHEIIVDSAEEARSILEMLGLSEAVRTIKVRQTAHYKDFEICIDEIDGLGSFIELEKIAEQGAADEIQKEMLDFLMTLGISAEDQVTKGYDILMMEQGKQH